MPGFSIFADMLLSPDDDEREYVLREVFGATMRPGQRLPRHSAFAPGDAVAAVLNGASGTLLEAMLWALPGETETDTLHQAPIRRCIIPAASYHVHGEPEGFDIEVVGFPFFGLAGLWRHHEGGFACTVLTTKPSVQLRSYGITTMPAILKGERQYEAWLSGAHNQLEPFAGRLRWGRVDEEADDSREVLPVCSRASWREYGGARYDLRNGAEPRVVRGAGRAARSREMASG